MVGDESTQDMRQVLLEAGVSPDALEAAEKAEAAREKGDSQTWLRWARQACERCPTSAILWQLRAQAAYVAGKGASSNPEQILAESEAACERALTLDPELLHAHLLAGEQALDRRDAAAALGVVARIKPLVRPEDTEAVRAQANFLELRATFARASERGDPTTRAELTALEQAVAAVRDLRPLPPQGRALVAKIDGVLSELSKPRFVGHRAAFLTWIVLGLFPLLAVPQVRRAADVVALAVYVVGPLLVAFLYHRSHSAPGYLAMAAETKRAQGLRAELERADSDEARAGLVQLHQSAGCLGALFHVLFAPLLIPIGYLRYHVLAR